MWQPIMLGRISLLVASLALGGCATMEKAGTGVGNMKDKALESLGLKKAELPPVPEVPESAKPDRKLRLRVAASDSLNVDPNGRSLSLVVRIYKLRNATAFLNAPHEIFGNAAREKEVLAEQLIDTRELLLLPAQQRELSEHWTREATHVGVVALFRSPSPQRWRHAFEMESLQFGDGIVLGAHACGLSVASGNPVGVSAEAMKLDAPTCPSNGR